MSDLLQIPLDDHVLAFDRQAMYVASGDHVLSVNFIDSAGVAPILGSSSTKKEANVAQTRVSYPDIWRGISLDYAASASGIVESTWTIAPGTDPGQIHLRYNAPVTIEANGDLRVSYPNGWMRESAPVAWQEIDGRRKPVQVAFRKIADTGVGFTVAEYDSAHSLLIDPTMQWNTFMGGSLWTVGYAVVLDRVGNIYVAGRSSSTWGTPVTPHSGYNNIDGFVAKFNSSGVLQWNTFLGLYSTTGHDMANCIVVDRDGNVYVGGYSALSWGTPVTPHAGAYDSFIAKLSPTGTRLWHTFLGSTDNDYPYVIEIDPSGDLLVGGRSDASWGTPLNPYSGAGGSTGHEAFIARLASNDGSMQWNTFLGGTGTDLITDIAGDGDGNLILAGYSNTSWGTPVNAHAGDMDAFVAKMSGTGVLQWNTFLGGSGTDYGQGVVVDETGSIFVGGFGNLAWGTPLNAYSGGDDVFVAKLAATGVLQWHTFLGTATSDVGGRLALGTLGNIAVVGSSDAAWGNSPVRPYSGNRDGFAAMLDSDGTLLWHGFLGGANANATYHDFGNDIAVDCAGNVYVAGTSESPGWGTPISPFTGSATNTFIARIGEPGHAVCTTAPAGEGSFDPSFQIVADGQTANFAVTAEAGYSVDTVTGCGGEWTGSNPYTTGAVTTNCLITASFASDPTYTVMPIAGPPVSLIAGGTYHSLAVKGDGTVAGWGISGDSFQKDPPPGLDEVIAVSAGDFFSLALKQDGTVVGWGSNTWQQITIPEGLSEVKAISAGGDHTLALKKDGTVVAWGCGTEGQTAVPEGLTGVVAVAASTAGGHSLALKGDGTVVAWGWDLYDQASVPDGLVDVVAISAGTFYSLALKSDGTVVAWGWEGYSVPEGLSDVVALASGGYHSLALKRDGTVVAWGNNAAGQSDVPEGLTGVVAVSAGITTSLALKGDGTVVAWGDNSVGQTTVPESINLKPFQGVHGTISPEMPQSVTSGGTSQFTVTPETGYSPTVGGTCGGTLSGDTYTTDSISSHCTVVASFKLSGDVNRDEVLDLSDALVALQIMAGIQTTDTVDPAADINGDGRIGVAEVLHVLRMIGGISD